MKKSVLIWALFLMVLPLMSFQKEHKYYSSVTQIEYVEKEKSLQIIARVFTDDLEKTLQQRYDKTLILGKNQESYYCDAYIKKYLLKKLKIKINSKEAKLVFIGKKYDSHEVKCFLEIENVIAIESIEVSNMVLFDLFEDQQNIVKTDINNKQKSFTLTQHRKKVLLEFK